MLNIELKKSIDEYIKNHFVNVTLKNDFTDESENVTKSGKNWVQAIKLHWIS